jgi:hypothetical protein
MVVTDGRHGGREDGRRRDEPEDEADQRTRRERDGRRREIEANLAAPRQFLNVQGAQQTERAPADRQAGRRRGEGERQAFGDQLARNPPAPCAEGESGGELFQPRPRSNEHEVRDVDAADEQHEERPAPHQVQRRPNVADHVVLQRADDRMESGVDDEFLEMGKALEVRRVEPVDLGLRLIEGRARFEPGDLLEVVAVPHLVRLLDRRERQRSPQHDVGPLIDEVLRHDADHGEGVAVEAYIAADDRRVATEGRLPEAVAQNDLQLVAQLAFGIGKRAAKLRLHAEYPEE